VMDDAKQLVQIPFNSSIKFNCMVRDMNKKELNPSSAQDNMTVFLKGAPERVVTRCSTILMEVNKDGTCREDPLDERMNGQIDAANKKFGGSGERVLAFARKQLDPNQYKKSSHGFDISKW
jgi:magnesium-transporting ATPase (P-type)